MMIFEVVAIILLSVNFATISFRERSLFTGGGGRCKSENRAHSKFAPPRQPRTQKFFRLLNQGNHGFPGPKSDLDLLNNRKRCRLIAKQIYP